MATTLNPYLSFRDNAREAMEFYRDALGGELTINTYGEYGDNNAPEANLVMHAQLTTPNGLTLMGADNAPGTDYSPGGFACSLSGDDGDELRGYWAKLSDGGAVQVPLEKQMWGDEFGMCADRLGVTWMVNIVGSEA